MKIKAQTNSKTEEKDVWKIYNSEDVSFIVKRFLLAYNETPNFLKVRTSVNMYKLQSSLMKKYGLEKSDFTQTRFFRDLGENKFHKYHRTIFCHLKMGLMVNILPEEVELAYSSEINIREVAELKSILQHCKRKPKARKRKFFMVKQDPYSGLDLEEFDVKFKDINLIENYNDDLIDLHDKLIQFLNKGQTSGLVLLHGVPGTGKTTYLRHLINSCNTRFIYIPNNLFHHLMDPTFFSFISQKPNSVIILEDCEELLKARTESSNNGISNLLNLADGLLGDALKIKIICTFNMDIKNIDPALIRKGRLYQRYQFAPLSLNKVNTLLKKINSEVVSLKEMTLAEVFNYAESNGADTDIFPVKKIGFN